MKYITAIIFFSLCFFSYAQEIIYLPKDTASGYKNLYKSLTGNYYKAHGFKIVNKKDGHPVRSGYKSLRFEVRFGDCGADKDRMWSDCKNDRERHELSTGKSPDLMTNGEYWFSWSIYFPEDHINLYPLSNNYGQFHQTNGPPVFMFKERKYGYSIVRTIGDGDYDEKVIVRNKMMAGNWFDVLINVKWSKKNDGFFKLWVNDEQKYSYNGPTKTEKHVYQKFGVYRTGISRYLNYKNRKLIKKCLDEKDGTSEEVGAFYSLGRGYIEHDISMQLFEKCKGYYQEMEVPTTIVYFDEVRKGRSKKSVSIK